MTTTNRTYFQSRRRAGAGALFLITGLFSGFVAMAVPASADGPAFFAPSPAYDTYLKAEHRGLTALSKDNDELCPDLPTLGETAWHFVLDGSSHDFLTLDVAFSMGVPPVTVTLSGLTPKAASDPTFNPLANFAPFPDGKHAYVFTATTGTIVDAAAHVLPNALIGDFQLSHTCVDGGTTTTTTSSSSSTTSSSTTSSSTTSSSTTSSSTTTTSTTVPTTTTTSTTVPTTTTAVLDTVITQGANPTTTTTVRVGGLQATRSLPATGAGSTLPWSQAAIVLIGIGLAFLGAARVRVERS